NSLLTTVPSSTLNVVVAKLALGGVFGGISSKDGNFSTIIGYEDLFFAAGGLRGGINNSNTPPGESPGGSLEASEGTITKIAGGNGGKGTSALLGLLLSSGAGGQGANSGGAGGAPLSSLLLGNENGKDGTVPGGGGSGAINSPGSAIQYGGSGAAGRVIISYNCPAYNITGVSAGLCSNNYKMFVTLTSNPASLPVGNYVVTYNRTLPSATGLTANLTVITAGRGTFYSDNFLNQINASTITITKLTSASCSANITTNNRAVITGIIPETLSGGTISGASSVCQGDTTVLTLSGNAGTVVKWQIFNGFTWEDVPNPSTSNTYTTFPMLSSHRFRAIVGDCNLVSESKTVELNSEPLYISYDLSENPNEYPRTTFVGALLPTPQYISITYNTLEGEPTAYSVEWDSDAIPNQDITPYTFTYWSCPQFCHKKLRRSISTFTSFYYSLFLIGKNH
ncbi:hypothetical protein OA93_23905, partial [Flavobacterium sp. KMS]